jgi:hypothetical protein
MRHRGPRAPVRHCDRLNTRNTANQGACAVPYLTNETEFNLTAYQEHLIVIRADSIGLDLAWRLGAAITALEAASPQP